MATCGLWPNKLGFVAVVVDDDSATIGLALAIERAPDAVWDLLGHVEAHHGLDCDFVVTDEALAAEAYLRRVPPCQGARFLVVSCALVRELCVLTGARPTPRRLAAFLARLPLCRPIRRHLVPMRAQLQLF